MRELNTARENLSRPRRRALRATACRARLLWLVLLAVLPALGLILYTGIEQWRLAAAAAQGEAMCVVQLMAGTHKELFTETQRPVQLLA